MSYDARRTAYDGASKKDDPVAANYDKILANEEKAIDKAGATCAIGLMGIGVAGLLFASALTFASSIALSIIAGIATGAAIIASITGAILESKHSKKKKFVQAEKQKYLELSSQNQAEKAQQLEAAKAVDDFCVKRYGTKSAITKATLPKQENRSCDDSLSGMLGL